MRFRRFVVSAAGFAVIACACAIPQSRAQEVKRPVGVVSIAPLEKLLQDTTYLLKACNVQELAGIVNLMANQYTQGIDRTKPLGAFVYVVDDTPAPLIFLPVTDNNLFFGALASVGIEPEDLGDGLFEIDVSGQTLFAKHTGSWLFIAQAEDGLANLPADPSAALGESPKKFDVALRVNVQALPAETRDWVSEQVRVGMDRGLAEQSGQTAEAQTASKELAEANIAQIQQLVSDTEQVFLGWNIEPNNQHLYLDSGAQFVDGSKLANQLSSMKGLKSDYTQLAFPGSAARFRFTSVVPEDEKANQIKNIDNSLSQLENAAPPEFKELVAAVLPGLKKVFEQTIQEGIFDGAGSVSLADDSLRVLIGGRVADGNALAAELKRAAAGLSATTGAPKFQFDIGTHKGMTLHSVLVSTEGAGRDAKKIFGDTMTVMVATGPKGFVIGIDPAGDASLKAAIDRTQAATGQAVSPMDATIEVAQVLKFAQSVSPNSLLDNAVQMIAQYVGKDKIQLSGSMIERGATYRFLVEEGVLRAGGAAAKSGSAGNGGF